jgi:hypothetical protein
MFTVSVVPVVLVPPVLLLRCSLLRVRPRLLQSSYIANFNADSKQARDLVQILTESKQQIDPRLHEMARYGGGGGRWGGGRGRGGGRGGGGGGRGG